MRFTLDQIVREYLIESFGAETLDKRYPRYFQIGISGLRDLNNDIMGGDIKYTTLTVEDNDIAYLPKDYVRYTRIAVCKDGQMLALGLNQNMCPPETDTCGNIDICQLGNTTNSDESYYFYTTYDSLNQDGYNVGRQYGLGGGQNSIGYYKVFEKEGYIALQNLNADYDSIILEYVADLSLNENGEYTVHPNDVEALKAWIFWKSIERNLNYPYNAKEDARRTYGREKMKANARHTRFSITELMSAVRSGFRSSPKI